MWIGEVDGARVGSVRLDVRSGVGEIALAVSPEMRGRGFGRGLLVALLEQVRNEQQVTELIARVHSANAASMRAFCGVGFEPAGSPANTNPPKASGAASCDFVVLRRDPRLPMEMT
jgi:RimJ/RimL family protein N-acetyltransferase